ncbi:glycosyltransferase [Acinetobacter pseudolwoffii]|uniref:glycosyltransferase n=1 Tax=Acinetobacter pseudolwoffii TaxID=2053287 RepID=UPI002577B631|nr:glycosyltransferase [Acinetobacter pseudolwoffii]MDM1344688.1 glycosyltransferase [Acinetobacter pseudolwoffii]
MKKIFITIGKLDRGGAEIRLLNLINDLNNLKVKAKFYIYINSGEVGVLTEDFLKFNNLTIIYGRRGVKGLKLFYKVLNEINPEILHLNSSLAAGIYAFIGRLSNIKYIYSHIRTAEHYGNGIAYHFKQRFFAIMMNIFSDQVVGVCDGARKLSNTNLKKWKTIYNGVEVKKDIDINYNKFTLICIGRQNIAKNQIFLIGVFKHLMESYPNIDWRLDFYGREDPNIMLELEKKVNSYNLKEYISFCGETHDPLNTISNYHLLLLPSIREGLPGVVLEALSVGLECVVSNLDGCREISDKIPYVKILDNYDESKWAAAIYESCSTVENRNAIIESLYNSPFNNSIHVKNMRDLWQI